MRPWDTQGGLPLMNLMLGKGASSQSSAVCVKPAVYPGRQVLEHSGAGTKTENVSAFELCLYDALISTRNP